MKPIVQRFHNEIRLLVMDEADRRTMTYYVNNFTNIEIQDFMKRRRGKYLELLREAKRALGALIKEEEGVGVK